MERGRVFFVLGAALGALALAATIYAWPMQIQLTAFATFFALMAMALVIGAIDYVTHLVARDSVAAEKALNRAKIKLVFFLGGLASLAGYVVLLATSTWIGGIS